MTLEPTYTFYLQIRALRQLPKGGAHCPGRQAWSKSSRQHSTLSPIPTDHWTKVVPRHSTEQLSIRGGLVTTPYLLDLARLVEVFCEP